MSPRPFLQGEIRKLSTYLPQRLPESVRPCSSRMRDRVATSAWPRVQKRFLWQSSCLLVQLPPIDLSACRAGPILKDLPLVSAGKCSLTLLFPRIFTYTHFKKFDSDDKPLRHAELRTGADAPASPRLGSGPPAPTARSVRVTPRSWLAGKG